MTSLDDVRALDRDDPLRGLRERFVLPDAAAYLDGNSLGALPRDAPARIADLVERQWGARAIRSWNEAGWIDAPERIGGKIARLLGTEKDEVIACDSTSVNIAKLLGALVAQKGTPATNIVSETENFPSDVHAADGVARGAGIELRLVGRNEVLGACDEGTAALLLTHVHYKSGARYDMAGVTTAAREKGVPVVWDLAHSAGAVPLNLAQGGADYAVGCGYKYLNGGPGAPAFLYVRRELQEGARPWLQGWMGDARRFQFRDEYRPAKGMRHFLVGTPPILGMAGLEAGLDAIEGVSMDRLWEKSVRLFDLMATLMDERCPEFALVTPRDADARGSHASFAHEAAWPVNAALIDRGVIGDFRDPDILRFGLTPLYTRFEDVWIAVDALASIMESGAWREEKYAQRSEVT